MSTDPTTPWRVLADAPHQSVTDDTRRLAMDLDPRNRTIRLGLRIVSGGQPDVSSGAISRSFFPAEHADWDAAVRWIQGEEAGALLALIEAGYRCEMGWTGDQQVSWSEEAWAAGATLYRGIARLIHRD